MRAADKREWATGGLPKGELSSSGDLVGNGPNGRGHHPPVGVGLAPQILQRCNASHANRNVGDAEAPRAAE